MFCTECGVRNSDGSKFCRECGFSIVQLEETATLLPPRASQSLQFQRTDLTDAESERVRHLLDMAFWHSEAGHVVSARTACEAALKIDPFSSSALSLLGLLYEKEGNVDKAIDVFEKIVAINPDSVADADKLEHLRQGIRDTAVAPSLVHQITPPALLDATRKYPNLPLVLASCIVMLVMVYGLIVLWKVTQPAPVTVANNTGITSIAPPPSTRPTQIAAPLPSANQGPSQPVNTNAPPTADIAPQNPGALDRMVAEAVDSRLRSARTAEQGNRQMPSIGALQPLTVPSNDIPNHVVSVGGGRAPVANHVVDVPPLSGATVMPASSVSTSSDQPSDGSDGDAPPPASHIIVTVHGSDNNFGGSGSTPLPSDSGSGGITLREDPGAALQQKALSLSQAGNYRAAEAAYESAIGAFQQDIAAGRNVDEARRGIDACQVAIQICKQSQ